MSKEVVIFGAGGHARSVADVILSTEPDSQLLFVDENARPDEKIFGFDVVPSLSLSEAHPDQKREFFVAIGDNKVRAEKTGVLGHFATAEIIAGDAHVGRDSQIEKGVFIGHEVYIGPLSRIGEGSIINTRAVLEHEVVVGRYTQIAPGAIIGGRVNIGDNVFIGLGARVIDRLNICSDAVIGASSTVVDNINEPGTYVGTPAVRIK